MNVVSTMLFHCFTVSELVVFVVKRNVYKIKFVVYQEFNMNLSFWGNPGNDVEKSWLLFCYGLQYIIRSFALIYVLFLPLIFHDIVPSLGS